MTPTPHVVVVGAGFAGHTAARGLLKRLRNRGRVTVIDRHDHFLYLPLLPEVAVGALEPRASPCRWPTRCAAPAWFWAR